MLFVLRSDLFKPAIVFYFSSNASQKSQLEESCHLVATLWHAVQNILLSILNLVVIFLLLYWLIDFSLNFGEFKKFLRRIIYFTLVIVHYFYVWDKIQIIIIYLSRLRCHLLFLANLCFSYAQVVVVQVFCPLTSRDGETPRFQQYLHMEVILIPFYLVVFIYLEWLNQLRTQPSYL